MKEINTAVGNVIEIFLLLLIFFYFIFAGEFQQGRLMTWLDLNIGVTWFICRCDVPLWPCPVSTCSTRCQGPLFTRRSNWNLPKGNNNSKSHKMTWKQDGQSPRCCCVVWTSKQALLWHMWRYFCREYQLLPSAVSSILSDVIKRRWETIERWGGKGHISQELISIWSSRQH